MVAFMLVRASLGAFGTCRRVLQTHGQFAPRSKVSLVPHLAHLHHWSIEFRSFLDQMESHDTYATSGILEDSPIHYPRVTVQGIGRLGFPFMDVAVEALKAVATRGSDAHTWNVPGRQVSLSSGEDNDLVDRLALQACHELGISSQRCDSQHVQAHLNKLVLTECGGPSTRVDPETEGSFGTLIIQLPSRFSGGSLTTNHCTKTKTFLLAEFAEDRFQYVAFYKDCKHEFHTVTTGVRLCLVYDLVCQTEQVPSWYNSNLNVATQFKLQGFAKAWRDDPHLKTKLGYKSSQKYTLDTFNVASLQGADALVFAALQAARSSVGNGRLFQMHLVVMMQEIEDIDDPIGTCGWWYPISPSSLLNRRGKQVFKHTYYDWEMCQHSSGWLVDATFVDRVQRSGVPSVEVYPDKAHPPWVRHGHYPNRRAMVAIVLSPCQQRLRPKR